MEIQKSQNLIQATSAAKQLGIDMKYFDSKTFQYCNKTLILSFINKLDLKYPLKSLLMENMNLPKFEDPDKQKIIDAMTQEIAQVAINRNTKE